jgi:hypothetical protein
MSDRCETALYTALYFAGASVLLTLSTVLVIWSSHGGVRPWNFADIYIFAVDWPTMIVRGNFYVASQDTFLMNAVGWAAIGAALALGRSAMSNRR